MVNDSNKFEICQHAQGPQKKFVACLAHDIYEAHCLDHARISDIKK